MWKENWTSIQKYVHYTRILPEIWIHMRIVLLNTSLLSAKKNSYQKYVFFSRFSLEFLNHIRIIYLNTITISINQNSLQNYAHQNRILYSIKNFIFIKTDRILVKFSFDEHNSITICYFWIKMTILLFIEF